MSDTPLSERGVRGDFEELPQFSHGAMGIRHYCMISILRPCQLHWRIVPPSLRASFHSLLAGDTIASLLGNSTNKLQCTLFLKLGLIKSPQSPFKKGGGKNIENIPLKKGGRRKCRARLGARPIILKFIFSVADSFGRISDSIQH